MKNQKDITKSADEVKLWENIANDSEDRYRKTLDNMMEGCAIIDFNWRYLYANKVNAKHAHSTQENLIGKTIMELLPTFEGSAFHIAYKKCLEERIPQKIDAEFTFQDGTSAWYEVNCEPIPEGIFLLSLDITERKKTENALRISEKKYRLANIEIEAKLKEKDILLKEIYHRSKNTLQLISSLINLKAMSVNNKDFQEIVSDVQDRIRAIALVHEKLYNGADLSKVNLKDYIDALVKNLMDTNCVNSNIKLKTDMDDITLLIDSVVPCGLIITELILNSFKHAFPDNKKGLIEITLKKLDNNFIKLSIADSGIGFDKNYIKENTLGLQIFRSIAEGQLQAKVDLETNNGTKWTLTFKDDLYNARV